MLDLRVGVAGVGERVGGGEKEAEAEGEAWQLVRRWPVRLQALLASQRVLGYGVAVSYTGTVKNGVVVLPPGAQLPEGIEVEVTPLEARADDPPFLRAILKLAKPRDWPEDFALNHAHYAKGHPKKS